MKKNLRFNLIKSFLKDKNVLDIGAANISVSGISFHKLISDVSKKTIGIDINKKDIEKFEKMGYDVRFGDATNFDIEEKFDVVFAGEIIEHLSNLDGFIKSVKRHMRKNSLFIITTPNYLCLKFILKETLLKKPKTNPQHVCCFDEHTLRNLLEENGFIIVDIKYVSFEKWGKLSKCLPVPKKIKHDDLIVFCKLGDERNEK